MDYEVIKLNPERLEEHTKKDGIKNGGMKIGDRLSDGLNGGYNLISNVGSSYLEAAMKEYSEYRSSRISGIMSKDWDNCIIIDACRFDVFDQQNQIPGNLSYRYSGGSYTGGFFESNFLDSTYNDTVYITSNPVPRVDKWCQVDIDSVFYEVIEPWKEHWDDDLNTVPPAPVRTAIEDALSDYPNKRILGHFIQPHQPFIGETGKQINARGMRAYDEATEGNVDSGKKVWELLKNGEISRDRVWEAYRENLEIVLPHVESLCDTLAGKTVVTSDHGNLFGEFAWPFPVRRYGHPPNVYSKKLRKVPWLEIESNSRREIVSESPVRSSSSSDESERLKRLSALGYR